jgi:flagellum-specific ATP synthase
MSAIVDDRHARSAADIRRMLAAYAQAEDLLRIGAYKAGSDPELDRAIQLRPRLRRFFEQRPEEFSGLRETLYAIEQLVAGPHG